MIIATVSNENQKYDVEIWDNYGIVCPCMLTSNGNALMTANAIKSYLDMGYVFSIVPGISEKLTEQDCEIVGKFFKLIQGTNA